KPGPRRNIPSAPGIVRSDEVWTVQRDGGSLPRRHYLSARRDRPDGQFATVPAGHYAHCGASRAPRGPERLASAHQDEHAHLHTRYSWPGCDKRPPTIHRRLAGRASRTGLHPERLFSGRERRAAARPGPPDRDDPAAIDTSPSARKILRWAHIPILLAAR